MMVQVLYRIALAESSLLQKIETRVIYHLIFGFDKIQGRYVPIHLVASEWGQGEATTDHRCRGLLRVGDGVSG